MNKNKRRASLFREWFPILFILLTFAGYNSCEDLLTDLDSGDPRDKLVDKWKVDESPGNYKSEMLVYYVEISKHPTDTSRVVISNFYNVIPELEAEAVLSGSLLSLPVQTLGGGYRVRGAGQIQGSQWNEILWTYFVDDGSGQEDKMNAVYTRFTF